MNQQYLESLRRTLDRMYSCRDLEISNLWQRSIFLGTFLVLCFTGYGVLVHSMLTLEKDTAEQFMQFHFVCCMLAMLSIIFSVLWIQMAKASKAWYEVYEKYICYFQDVLIDGVASIEGKYGNGKYQIDGFGNPNYKLEIDDSLLSSKGGGYSPSKINIVIGQVSVLIWGLLLLTHVLLFIFNLIGISFNMWFITIVLSIVLLAFLYFIYLVFKRSGNSSIKYKSIIKTEKYYLKIIRYEKSMSDNCFFKQVRSGFLHGD